VIANASGEFLEFFLGALEGHELAIRVLAGIPQGMETHAAADFHVHRAVRIKRQGPKRPSLYVMTMPEDVAAVQYQESGLDVAAPQSKMLQRCDTNYFKEHTGEPLKRRRPEIDSNPHQFKDEENSSPRQAFAYASLSDTGEDKSSDPCDDEAIFIPEADEIDLDNCPLPEVQTPEHLDGPHTGDLIEVGEGAFVQVEEAEDDAGTPRDPDALTGDRRGDGTFDLSAFVARFVASRIDLSKVEGEMSPQTVLPIARAISRQTGADIERCALLVEDALWEQRRPTDPQANTENLDDHPLAIPF